MHPPTDGEAEAEKTPCLLVDSRVQVPLITRLTLHSYVVLRAREMDDLENFCLPSMRA